MQFLKDASSLAARKVLLRADFDVPLENGKVTDETRIKAVLPTIKFLLENKAKIVLLAHLGRPEGKVDSLSLKPVAGLLEIFLGKSVVLLENLEGKAEAEITLLENLRFWPGEEENDPDFAQKLATLGDIYVNDGFAACHREHASIVRLPKMMPSYAGLRLEQEVRELSRILKTPERPLMAILGGAKIETKLPAINNLSKVADKVLVGGRLMFEISGEKLSPNIIVAEDDVDGKDIGKKSIERFNEEISRAAMVVWNGPVGKFEDNEYMAGTKAIIDAIIESGAYSIIGGGDTIAALNKFNSLDRINYVSTGGGAMLEFLAGKKLPGLEALEYDG